LLPPYRPQLIHELTLFDESPLEIEGILAITLSTRRDGVYTLDQASRMTGFREVGPKKLYPDLNKAAGEADLGAVVCKGQP
jgi:hypothetical protein